MGEEGKSRNAVSKNVCDEAKILASETLECGFMPQGMDHVQKLAMERSRICDFSENVAFCKSSCSDFPRWV